MGKSTTSSRAFRLTHNWSAILALSAMSVAAIQLRSSAGQAPKTQDARITVRYTDVRQAAGITFRQDSTQTEEAGVGGAGHYGQGVAVGDFDNDGYPDLYVTGYGGAILYHNNGDGTFTDATFKARVADEGQWSTSAGWFDYDKDGWLDLVVTNYIEWTPKTNIWCGERRPGYRSYCNPGNYKGQKTTLYHNNHDGTFTDVSDASGVGKPESKGMGVVLADFNNDGWPDIAVANDTWPNFLFI